MAFLSFDDTDLKWAIGNTRRTSFVWTIAPPGTMFYDCPLPVEDFYLSIFKWTLPLWSALDIRIDEIFISFLRENHTRKEFNDYFTGFDNDYFKAPRNVKKRPLPLGNHVISICLAAGILQENRQRRFSLREDRLEKETWRQVDAVAKALQQYLAEVEVSREQIENRDEYKKKKEQWARYLDTRSKRGMNKIWNEANVAQMKNFPANTIFRELIQEKLMDEDFFPSLSEIPPALEGILCSRSRPLTEEEREEYARWHVREAWKKVQDDISDRIGKKLKQYAAAGRVMPGDKDAAGKLELEARFEVLREIAAEHQTDDLK